MELRTKYHGTRHYKEEDIISFKGGIPGLENLRKFILFPAEENELFYILQSIENCDIGLVMVSPFNIVKDYEFELSDTSVKRLLVDDRKDLIILNTVTLNSNVNKITANLKAPFIINIKRKIGEQIILDNSDYKIKYPIFEEGA